MNASHVADFFLCFARDHGDYLTNLRLQKLIYYGQAWNLALHNKPLFPESIEAWVHGPVIPHVYGRFKKYRWNPIAEEVAYPAIIPPVIKHLTEVFSVYGKYSAWDLERMTHQEQPWINARKGLAIDAEGHSAISHEDMRQFYRALSAAKPA